MVGSETTRLLEAANSQLLPISVSKDRFMREFKGSRLIEYQESSCVLVSRARAFWILAHVGGLAGVHTLFLPVCKSNYLLCFM